MIIGSVLFANINSKILVEKTILFCMDKNVGILEKGTNEFVQIV